jgi:hypothetical protein
LRQIKHADAVNRQLRPKENRRGLNRAVSENNGTTAESATNTMAPGAIINA